MPAAVWLLGREAFRVATVLATSFVFFTYLLYALGTACSGRVDLRTDARLQNILSEYAHGLFTASESLRNLRPSEIQQHQYQVVGALHEVDLFELLGNAGPRPGPCQCNRVCRPHTISPRLLTRDLDLNSLTTPLPKRLAVFDAELAAIGRRLVNSCHLVLKPLWLAVVEHKRLAWHFGPSGRIYKLAVQGLEGLARELWHLESMGQADAAWQKTRTVEALALHLVQGHAGELSGPWPISLNMSKSVVSDLVLHATNAMDAAEQHLLPLMDGAIAALGRGKSLMKRSAAVQHQAVRRPFLYGQAPPRLSCDGSQLSRLLSRLAADVILAQQVFRGVVAPLIEQATEVSTIFVHVEANITTLASQLSLLALCRPCCNSASAAGADLGIVLQKSAVFLKRNV